MPDSDSAGPPDTIRLKDVYGVFILGPDDVQFRTGSISGHSCLVSDPERRGLLGPVIDRLVSSPVAQRRPWNQAELELLDEIIPQLQQNGIIEAEGSPRQSSRASAGPLGASGKPLSDARIAVVGHGILGDAVRALLQGMPCGSATIIESSSVAPKPPAGGVMSPQRSLPRPRNAKQWLEAVADHDWIIAAQDCFEPEELAALGKAAWQLAVPWSLVCFDGYEGWVGPTFIAGQTACFGCFRRRLFAGAGEPKHVFMDPGVKVHRVPSPWSAGPETGAWVSLITSMFALEFIAAMEGRSFTLNNMLIVHRLNLTFQRESVLRLPRCPDCSPRGGAPPTNVFAHVLGTRRKGG